MIMEDWADWEEGGGGYSDEEDEERLHEEYSDDEYREEEPDFQSGFKDLERITGTGTATVDGFSKQLQRGQRSPEEAAMDAVRGVLDGLVYKDFLGSKKSAAIDILQRTEKLYLMNIEIAVAAALWLADHPVEKRKGPTEGALKKGPTEGVLKKGPTEGASKSDKKGKGSAEGALKVDKKEFQEYAKRFSGVDISPIDLLRYIRLLQR